MNFAPTPVRCSTCCPNTFTPNVTNVALMLHPGDSLSQQMSATNPPITAWTLTGAPGWMSIDSSGLITGTVPSNTPDGTVFSVLVTATNANGSGQGLLTLTVTQVAQQMQVVLVSNDPTMATLRCEISIDGGAYVLGDTSATYVANRQFKMRTTLVTAYSGSVFYWRAEITPLVPPGVTFLTGSTLTINGVATGSGTQAYNALFSGASVIAAINGAGTNNDSDVIPGAGPFNFSEDISTLVLSGNVDLYHDYQNGSGPITSSQMESIMNFGSNVSATFNPGIIVPDTYTNRLDQAGSGDMFNARQSLQNVEVGQISGPFNTCMIVPIKLTPLANGTMISNATISFNLVGKSSPSANADLYLLARSTAEAGDWMASDYFQGPNDTSATLLKAAFVTPTTTNGVVTYSGPNLVNALKLLYASSPDNGLTPFWGFLRIGCTVAAPTGNYQFATSNNLTPALRPTITIQTSGTPAAKPGQLIFTWNQVTAGQVSAGVYDSVSGVLLRTIFGNIPYGAGGNVAVWDGKDDNGNLLTGNHVIKLLYHNVNYTWEGIVGNNSTANTGVNVWRGLQFIQGMSFGGGVAMVSTGYNEQVTALWKFSEGSPGVPTQLYPSTTTQRGTFQDIFGLCANDGTRTYFARKAGAINNYTFIMGLVNATGLQYKFTDASCVNPRYDGNGNSYQYITDYEPDQINVCTGLAVDGHFIYAAHGTLGKLKVYDKLTGLLKSSFTITNPGWVNVDSTTGNINVLSGTNTLTNFSVNTTSGVLTQVSTSTRGTSPISLILDSTGTYEIALDIATHQVKVFNHSTGTLLTTVGTSGGQPTLGPGLTTTDYWFSSSSFIALQSDGTFWIVDSMNERMLHYSLDGSQNLVYVETFEFRAANYVMGADCNNPNRMFSGFFEYAIDYTNPLTGSTGWSKTKNWLASLNQDGRYTANSFSGFFSVVTMSNSKTYALAYNNTAKSYDCIELTSSGSRVTNVTLPKGRLYADNSYRYFSYSTSTFVNNYFKRACTSWDGSNNPIFATATTVAASTSTLTSPSLLGLSGTASYIPFIDKTTGGIWPLLRSDPGLGMHLGGIKDGVAGFNFATMASTDQKTILYTKGINIAPGNQIAINGQIYTAVANGAPTSGQQFNCGLTTPASIINLAAKINITDPVNILATPLNNDLALKVIANKHLVAKAAANFGSFNQNCDSNAYLSYTGGALLNGGYDVGNQTPNYLSNIMQVAGSTIILGFHGEGWKGGEANLWYHYHESGLFLGYFGGPSVYTGFNSIIPFLGNNSFYTQVVAENGNTHMYYNNEGTMGGTGRVKVNALDTITVVSGTGALGQVIGLD